MKKSKIILIIYMIILIVSLCGCSNKNNENSIDDKVKSEIEYLDKKILGLMNKLNNITLDNYEVKSKEMKSKSEGENNGGQSSNGSSGSSKGGSSEEASKESDLTDEKTSQENSDSSSSSNSGSSQETSENIKVLQMQPSNILVINREDIDWKTIKSEVEVMYSTWNSILLDLYSVNVANEDILNFSRALDNAIIVIKSEKKQDSLNALANLYSYLPKYVNNLSIEESEKNILQTKSNILYAYAAVESKDWKEVQNKVNEADISYTKVTNDVNYIENNQKQVERVYVLIKELKTSVNLQDQDIFYIKYKNLMNSIN